MGTRENSGAKLLRLKCFSKVFVLSDYLNIVATEENFINAVEPEIYNCFNLLHTAVFSSAYWQGTSRAHKKASSRHANISTLEEDWENNNLKTLKLVLQYSSINNI